MTRLFTSLVYCSGTFLFAKRWKAEGHSLVCANKGYVNLTKTDQCVCYR